MQLNCSDGGVGGIAHRRLLVPGLLRGSARSPGVGNVPVLPAVFKESLGKARAKQSSGV
jgi:hypothetical protein